MDHIKQIASGSSEFRKMDDLILGKPYPIQEFFMKETKFGMTLTGLTRDPETGTRFNVFFPARFSKVVQSPESLEELNAQPLSIIYHGRNTENSNSIILDIISE